MLKEKGGGQTNEDEDEDGLRPTTPHILQDIYNQKITRYPLIDDQRTATPKHPLNHLIISKVHKMVLYYIALGTPFCNECKHQV